jgi:predicted SAM-dependent methyltransferase
MPNWPVLIPNPTVKQIAKNVIPSALLTPTLLLWRTYYWLQKTRVVSRTNQKIAQRIVGSARPIKLELGSSRRQGRADWTFSDIGGGGDMQLDLTQPIPFPNDSVKYIYSSHVLEHFSYPSPMLDLLNECYRILEVDGTFSIAVPNARIFLEAYLDSDAFDKDKYCSWDVGLRYRNSIDFVNFIAYMGGEHKHLFDVDNLVSVLEDAGFCSVRTRDFDPAIDLEERKHESIYALATK